MPEDALDIGAVVPARGSLLVARVDPAQIREPREIGIRAVEHITPLLGHRREMGVRREVACRAKALKCFAQAFEVPIRGVRDVDVREPQPAFDSCHDTVHREWPEQDLPVRGDSYKTKERDPCEADSLRSSQASVPPYLRRLVNRRIRIVGMNEHIDVGQDHAV